MADFAIAVKALVINQDQVLILKRRPDDSHKPGDFDIPGGRLNTGENPLEGLKREVKEEVNLDIKVGMVADVYSFTRDDGQQITMLIFVCQPKSQDIVLSPEHVAYKWVKMLDRKALPDWIKPSVCNTVKYSLHKN